MVVRNQGTRFIIRGYEDDHFSSYIKTIVSLDCSMNVNKLKYNGMDETFLLCDTSSRY